MKMTDQSRQLRDLAIRFSKSSDAQEYRARDRKNDSQPAMRGYHTGKADGYENVAMVLIDAAERLEAIAEFSPRSGLLGELHVDRAAEVDRLNVNGRVMRCPACEEVIEYVDVSERSGGAA